MYELRTISSTKDQTGDSIVVRFRLVVALLGVVWLAACSDSGSKASDPGNNTKPSDTNSTTCTWGDSSWGSCNW